MLKALKPPIIGHFDLIRLKSADPERSFTTWDRVWQKILRNLEFIADYGGVYELKSAALMKRMSEPYPKAEICQVSGFSFCGMAVSDWTAGFPGQGRVVCAVRRQPRG